MSIIRKIILLLFILFAPIVAHAAASDCQQLVSDGQVLCTQPYVFWNGTIQGQAASYDDYTQLVINTTCSAAHYLDCGNKTDSGFPGPYPCESSPSYCTLYTHIVTSGSEYNSQIVYYILNDNGGTSPPYYLVSWQWGLKHSACPSGTTSVAAGLDNYGLPNYLCRANYNTSIPTIAVKNTGCPICEAMAKMQLTTKAGDPVNLGGGNQYLVETDLSNSSTSPLSFTRYYNSQLQKWTNNLQMNLFITTSTNGTFATLSRENGNVFVFKQDSNGNWIPNSLDIIGQLTTTSIGFSFQTASNDIENYNSKGQLTSIQKLGGQILTFNYQNHGFLSSVVDQYGNTLNITTSNTITLCSNLNLITNLSFVASGSTTASNYSYSYGASNTCQITQANFPDNSYKQYTYSSNTAYTMSSVIDENHNTYDNYTTTYNGSPTNLGYVTTSNSLGSSANINKYTFTYTANSTTMTDSLGNTNTINNSIINGINYTKNLSSVCVDCNGLQANTTSYDSFGNLTSLTDFNGNTTTYTYSTN